MSNPLYPEMRATDLVTQIATIGGCIQVLYLDQENTVHGLPGRQLLTQEEINLGYSLQLIRSFDGTQTTVYVLDQNKVINRTYSHVTKK